MLTALLCALLVALPAAGEAKGCLCTEAKKSMGWCEQHQVGYIASVEIRSRQLFETMDAHGHHLELSAIECPDCRAAVDTSGFCSKHRMGFVKRLAYFSRLTYELARGAPVDPGKLTCETCRRNTASLGWCDRCATGMLAGVAVKDKAGYDEAERAVAVLRKAAEASVRCEHCAAAMVTDTECPICRITYKDGAALPKVAKP